MRSDPQGFSEVSAPLTAEAQALGAFYKFARRLSRGGPAQSRQCRSALAGSVDACAAEQFRRTLAPGGNDLRRQHSNGCVDLLAPRYLAGALRRCLASALRAYVRVAPARSARTIISVPMLIATKSSFLQLGVRCGAFVWCVSLRLFH